MEQDGRERFQTAAAASAQGTKCAEQQNKTYVSDSDRTALEIYRYVESAGCGQWRATTLGDLGNVVGSYDAKLTDLLKGLWSQKYIELRKWDPAASQHVSLQKAKRSFSPEWVPD